MADVRVTPQPWLWKPRTKPIRFIEVHATRGNTTPAAQKLAALNWVQSSSNSQGGWGSSFSYVIGTDGSMGTVLDDGQMPTYSAGFGGPGSEWGIDEYGISYELAQSVAQEPFTDACLRRAAKEIAAKCKRYGIPAVFLTIANQSGPVPTGLVRHDRCQNGYVLGKSDPGDQFNEAEFLTLMGEKDDMGMTPEERKELDTLKEWQREHANIVRDNDVLNTPAYLLSGGVHYPIIPLVWEASGRDEAAVVGMPNSTIIQRAPVRGRNATAEEIRRGSVTPAGSGVTEERVVALILASRHSI